MNSFHLKAYSLLRLQYSFLYEPPLYFNLKKNRLDINTNKRDCSYFIFAWIIILGNGVGMCYGISYFFSDGTTYSLGLVALHLAVAVLCFCLFGSLCLIFFNIECIECFNTILNLYTSVTTGKFHINTNPSYKLVDALK